MLTLNAALVIAHLSGPAIPIIANPASTHCISVGGRLEFVTTPRGQIGICVFPNGRRVEEWRLFHRAQTKRPGNNVRAP